MDMKRTHKGIFITGTDTGVGKTFVAAGLIKAMREKGINVCPMKPVETGCKKRNGKLIPADAVKLLKASGIEISLDAVNPYRFRQPLAPAVAAEHEGVVIKRSKLISAYNRLSKSYDFIVIEGAGGIMTPVYKEYLYLDMIKDLALPLIIVSRPGLGTINHTLLTIEAARSRRINVYGVIIKHASMAGKDLSEKSNPEIIESIGKVPVLGIIPYLKNPASLSSQLVFHSIAEKIIRI